MKQPTKTIAVLATGLILASVLTGLVVSSHERDACQNSLFETGSSKVDLCNTATSPTFATSDQQTPTLAPPRPETSVQIGPSSNEVAKGQPVFLKVETDQNGIEVGWESP
jgi:hypothetical protein